MLALSVRWVVGDKWLIFLSLKHRNNLLAQAVHTAVRRFRIGGIRNVYGNGMTRIIISLDWCVSGYYEVLSFGVE